MPEDVLGEGVEALVVLERAEVVELGKPLDGRGQQEYGPGVLLEHDASDRLLVADEGERKADRLVDPAPYLSEEVHVLDLLRREVHERIEGGAVVDREVLREAQ